MADFERADELAKQFTDAWAIFDAALYAEKRKYPMAQFNAMFSAFEAYFENRKGSPYIHREVGQIVSSAHEYLLVQRKRVPELVHKHSWRMSYMLFGDHDPLEELEDCLDD
jgi:hypothetical protein